MYVYAYSFISNRSEPQSYFCPKCYGFGIKKIKVYMNEKRYQLALSHGNFHVNGDASTSDAGTIAVNETVTFVDH